MRQLYAIGSVYFPSLSLLFSLKKNPVQPLFSLLPIFTIVYIYVLELRVCKHYRGTHTGIFGVREGETHRTPLQSVLCRGCRQSREKKALRLENK